MQISVVIPTCDRKKRLISLLRHLERSTFPILEVIIVDSGDDQLLPAEIETFTHLDIQYIQTEKSVCIQRNAGIRLAKGSWIFLCDDDIEVPADYLAILANHIGKYPQAGAVSGQVLQQEKSAWVAVYPEKSVWRLGWKYIFGLSIWGGIECRDNFWGKRLKKYFRQKGNHISKAGWPVITDFSGHYSVSPVYGLGASLVRKDWLLHSPYDETLDPHGIGDNYGVALGFPVTGIHIVNGAHVYHHQEPLNRLQRPLQYLRRVLALDYFIDNKPELNHIKKGRLLWSLTGNLIAFILVRDGVMIRPAFQAWWRVATGRNPYSRAARLKQRKIEPAL